MNSHLVVDNLSFAYSDGRKALRDISISAMKGEHIALVGPNGAGKTTLLLHLNGILRGSGNIVVEGEKLEDSTIKSVRRRVGLIFQDPNDQLFCPTVRDDVAFGPLHFDLDKEKIRQIVRDSLQMVDMEGSAERLTHHLSLGERRRISIAAVLACNPDILAFDEPSASLDPKRRRELIEFIKRSDKTVLIATHDLDLALSTCQRCVVMNEGKIVADGEINSLLRNEALLLENDLELPPSIKHI